MTTTFTDNDWVECSKPNPQVTLRLFCFPYAGGGASVFRAWPDLLPAEIEVCSIQLPGRETKLLETPLTRLTPIVQTLAQVLKPYLDLPFAFFGHSMGALVGFELSRELRRRGLPKPVHLFVSGHRAPQLPNPDPPIHHLPDSEFVAEIRNLHGTPEEVLKNAELMELMLPLLRADFSVCETYIYEDQEPLSFPISVFGGLQDSRISPEELEAWRIQTHKSFTWQMFRGNHFFLQSARKPLLMILAGYLMPFLKKGL